MNARARGHNMEHLKYIVFLELLLVVSFAGAMNPLDREETLYVGCYHYYDNDIFPKKLDLPKDTGLKSWGSVSCPDACHKKGYRLGALRKGTDCYCGGNDRKLTDTIFFCDGPCETNCKGGYWDATCGSNDRDGIVSVYRKNLPESYFGCKKYVRGMLNYIHDDTAYRKLTIDFCVKQCKRLGYPLAGLQEGLYCACAGQNPDHDPASRPGFHDACTWTCPTWDLANSGACTTPCSGRSSEICGGKNAMSLYKTTEWDYDFMYYGCFRNDIPALLQVETVARTVPNCVTTCRILGYSMAGASANEMCFCGGIAGDWSKVLSQGRAANCNYPCRGRVCGGPSALSVYKTNEESYLGCFKDDYYRVLLPSTMQTDNEMTIPKCVERCRSFGFPLAGLENGKECFCGGKLGDADNVLRLGPYDQCTSQCGGDKNTHCGGPWALSVYKTMPWSFDELGRYLDCFRTDNAGVLDPDTYHGDNYQTIHKCLQRCRDGGYAMAGLQYRKKCYCGGKDKVRNNIRRLGRADNCNSQCKGNKKQFCGGWNALSVYLTGVDPDPDY